MSKRWVREHHNDAHYKKAKREGYRARSAYKLLQINRRYKIIRSKDNVIDLGSAPGSWLQVIRNLTEGKVIGIDLNDIKPIEGVTIMKGDMTRKEAMEKLVNLAGGEVNTIVSDMSPNISGNYSMDQASSIYLGEMALQLAERILTKGGNFVVKIFEGDMFRDFTDKLKEKFRKVKVHNPKASRKTSSEVYVIGKNFIWENN